MNKYLVFSLYLPLILLISCAKQEMEMKNYSYSHTFHLTEDTTLGGLSISIEAELPVKYHNKEILTSIQQQIVGKMFGEIYTSLPVDSIIPRYVSRLYDDYKISYGNDLEKYKNLKGPMLDNEIQVEAVSMFLDDKILSFSYERYAFMGGAHGNSNRYFYNFDLSNGHILKESDIFIDNYKSPLTELIKQCIVEDNAEIESVADLNEFDFWEDEIKPNNNFYISDEGIVYVFNPYEIAPYSTGQTEVTLPYNRLKVLLKPDNLISYLYTTTS
ncbi:MAG: hypothetical protein H6Q19_1027 [Bacteroidetes bacterium]|nr:hypothetical protein [Bacteroidota bacterium]